MTNGSLKQIVPINGVLRCETLQLGLRLVDGDLAFFDLRTGELAVDESEYEREAKEMEREAKEVERAAKEAERAARELEREARERAEAKNRELLLEIEQLKKRLGEE